jgi:crossover junction endodeoxyribonuclease RuvC
LPPRLKVILSGVSEVVATYQPACAAIEKVFVNVNPQSTLLLGQARGAAITALVGADLEVAEYTPTAGQAGRGRHRQGGQGAGAGHGGAPAEAARPARQRRRRCARRRHLPRPQPDDTLALIGALAAKKPTLHMKRGRLV